MSPTLSPAPAAVSGPVILVGGTQCPGLLVRHLLSVGQANSSEPEAAPSHMRHQPLRVLPIPGPMLWVSEKNSLFGSGLSWSGLGPLSSSGVRSMAHRAWPALWSGHSRFLLGKQREGTPPSWPTSWRSTGSGLEALDEIPSCSVDKPQRVCLAGGGRSR